VIAFVTLRDTRPCLWLAVYALAFVCVLSFIAFEMLDLDGSDLQTDPRHATFKPAEAEHVDDVRRASLALADAVMTPVLVMLDDRPVRDERLASPSSRPLPPTWRPGARLLARASLADVPPAA
jgi:hypothetical protein